MNKKRRGFSIGLAIMTFIVTSIAVVASLSTLTKKQDTIVNTSSYVKKCIVEEGAALLTSQACAGTIEGCKSGIEKDCNTLFEYTDSHEDEVFEVAANICDSGGSKACLFLINKCVEATAYCDRTGDFDVNSYLETDYVSANAGGKYIYTKGLGYYNHDMGNFSNFNNFVETVCSTEWADSKTLDSVACKIINRAVTTYLHDFDLRDRALFLEEDSTSGTEFTSGKAFLFSESTGSGNSGPVFCWGYNNKGQLGDDSTTEKHLPNALASPFNSTNFSDISASYHTCAIDTTGKVYCWGRNDYGQLGDDSTTERHIPTPLAPPFDEALFSLISSGAYHSCAIGVDEYIRCWGGNSVGQLGDGSSTERHTPVTLAAPFDSRAFSKVTTGEVHTCSIDTDGFVLCWGEDYYGQLGNGTSDGSSNSPVTLDEPFDSMTFYDISTYNCHTCAISTEDKIYCWGLNNSGQLGNDSTTDSEVPVVLDSPFDSKTFSIVSTGSRHTCAIDTDNKLWCWGENGSGQLGNDSTADKHVPTALASPFDEKTFSTVSAGSSHTCAIDTEGKAWCWGENWDGRIGDDSTTERRIPTSVDSGAFSAKKIASGTYHTVAIEESISTSTPKQAYITTTKFNSISGINEKVISVSITQNTPGTSAVKWLISSDERLTWKYWDSNSWETALTVADPNNPVELTAYDFTNSCTAQDIIDHLDEYNFGTDTHLDFAFDLQTPNGTDLPYVDEITVVYY